MGDRLKSLTLRMLAIALTIAPVTAQHKGEVKMRSVKDGVYSSEQAKRGSRIYRKACVRCHHPRQFAGPAYMDSWTGARVHDFLEVIRRTMPTENPGSLKRQQYADIVAFILRMNSIPSGEAEMSGDATVVKQIRIEGPYKWAKRKKQSNDKR